MGEEEYKSESVAEEEKRLKIHDMFDTEEKKEGDIESKRKESKKKIYIGKIILTGIAIYFGVGILVVIIGAFLGENKTDSEKGEINQTNESEVAEGAGEGQVAMDMETEEVEAEIGELEEIMEVETEEISDPYPEHYKVGEFVSLYFQDKNSSLPFGLDAVVSEPDGKISFAITDWGSYYDTLFDKACVYAVCEITNTGSTDVSVGPSMISFYADNQYIKNSYWPDDVMSSAVLSPGRGISGKVYCELNVNSVAVIEAEVGPAKYILKYQDSEVAGQSESFMEYKGMTDDAIEYNLGQYSEGTHFAYYEIAGKYVGTNPELEDISLSMYSSPEEAYIGIIEFTYKGISFREEIMEIKDNIYWGGGIGSIDIVFAITESESKESVSMILYLNDEYVDTLLQTEQFIS